MTKKESKKYGLLPPKIAESDTVSRLHFIVFDNENRGESQGEIKQMCMQDNHGIEANQIRVIISRPQANAIIEWLHKLWVVNYMLISFDLENNHENLEEDNLFAYSLESTVWDIRSTYHTALQAAL
jgi:hypothetical protein